MQSEQKSEQSVVRLVLDTNIVVSGLVWQGVTARLVDLATRGELNVDLVSSHALLTELRTVVTRRKIVKKLATQARGPEDLIRQYCQMIKLVEPCPIPPTVQTDPADDMVLAPAFAGKAHLIVTGDSDVLNLGRFRFVPIVTVAVAISMLGGPPARRRRRLPPKGGASPAGL